MRTKAKELRKVADKAVFFFCRKCPLKTNCTKRIAKEELEGQGWKTKCAITPGHQNKPEKRHYHKQR